MLYEFSLLHIDIARNSTDDFNLFHDKKKWRQIHNNPFEGPILLGFQLEMLIEGVMRDYRKQAQENDLIDKENLGFSNYQFSFVNVIKPGQLVEVTVKNTSFKSDPDNSILSNRVVMKADGKLALMGFKKESKHPLFLALPQLPNFDLLNKMTDRTYLSEQGFFVKRKFMTTSNAKNFLCSSQREQSEYFDEVEGQINFPEIFPCALISSAILEKAVKEQRDFKREPLVFTSHKMSIERAVLAKLRSNDCLHILIKQTQDNLDTPPDNGQIDYECYGVVNQQVVLFRALISLMPLA